MPEIKGTNIVIDLETVFKNQGVDELIKKLYELEKASLKAGQSLDFSEFSDEMRKNFKKTFNELEHIYEDFNKKLAQSDVKFAKFRNDQLKSGLGFTEKEIKANYDKIVGLNKQYNEAILKADKERADQSRTLLGKAFSELQEGVKHHISTITGIQESTLTRLGSSTALKIGGTAAAIAYGIVKLGEFAEKSEQAKLKFDTFINSEIRTNKLADELQELSKKTGISSDTLNEATLTLLKFGTAADKVPDKLKQLATISAKLNIPIEKLAEQLGRIDFKGFATKLDLTVIESEGIPIFQQLSVVTGKSVEELRKLAKISSEDVSSALDKLTEKGGQFSGALDKQTSSLTSLKSQLGETYDSIKEGIGDAFIDNAKDIVKTIKDVLDFLGPYVINFAQGLSSGLSSLFSDLKTLTVFSTTKGQARGILPNLRFGLFGTAGEIDKELKDFLGDYNSAKFEIGGKFFKQGQQIKKDLVSAYAAGFSTEALTIAAKQKYQAILKEEIKDLFPVLGAKPKDPKEPEKPDQKIIEERKKFYDQLLKLQREFGENERNIRFDGLFDVSVVKSERELDKFQQKISARLTEIRQIEEKLKKLEAEGFQAPAGFTATFNNQVELLVAQLDRTADAVFIEKLPIKVGKVEFIDKNGNRLNISKQISESLGKTNALDDAFGDPDKIDKPEKGSKFLELLFGSDKEQQDRGEKALKSAQKDIISALNLFFEAEQKKTDFLIEQQRKRIDEVNRVAALGNAEQLQIEEERLRKLEEKRAQSVRRQNAINAIQIVSQTALAVSSFATAITKQAAQEHPITAIAEGIALLAAVVAGIAQIKSLSQGFYEGTEYVDHKGNYRSGIDTVPANLTRGERVLTVQQNEAIGNISNKEVVRLTNIGRMADLNSGSSIYLDANKSYSDYYQRETVNLLRQQNEKLDRNTDAINNTFVDIRFHDNGWQLAQTKGRKQEIKRRKVF